MDANIFKEFFENSDYEDLKIMINYLDEELIKNNRFYKEQKKLPESKKSKEKSDLIRNHGNELYRFANPANQKYGTVICIYELALCYAETPHQLAKCFGNLSAMYMSLPIKKPILKSIEFALKFVDKNEVQFLQKLLKRRNFVQIQRSDFNFPHNFGDVYLCYPSKSEIPGLAGCIVLNGTLSKRFLSSTKTLECGEVIAVIDPFVFATTESLRRYYCANCDRSAIVRLPCDVCTQAMFCSEECKVQAKNGFHGLFCESNFQYDHFDELALKFAMKSLEIDGSENMSKYGYTCFDWSSGQTQTGMVFKLFYIFSYIILNYFQKSIQYLHKYKLKKLMNSINLLGMDFNF